LKNTRLTPRSRRTTPAANNEKNFLLVRLTATLRIAEKIMQEPTHILAGIIIKKSLDGKKPRAAILALTAALAFLSHGFLDKLANLTYHPAQPDFKSPVWIGYHLFIAVTTIVFLFLWWKKFKWGIIFATLPDADWIFIHGREIFNHLFHTHSDFYHRPYLHNFLNSIWENVPPLNFAAHFLDALPNYRHNPLACLWEFFLVALLLLILRLITMGRRQKIQLETLPKSSQQSNL
jgi:hypothetical protein